MPKISIIVPVYRAEKVLRQCVESIVSGEEKDLEIILVEDCSNDGSWALCQKLAEEYPQVVCLQNDRNRGVSYTRNRGLDAATGQYVIFVDSDDWVSEDYAKLLGNAIENHPGKLIVCGYTQMDYVNDTKYTKRDYGIWDTAVLDRRQFCRLSGAVMLQQLWNKIFRLSDLRKAGIRFDEAICVGEDYQFVMDAIEALDIQECVILPKTLYFYIRRGTGSLMDHWTEHETYEQALSRAMRLENLCGFDADRLESFKKGYAYRILWQTKWPGKKKRQTVRKILGRKKGNRFCCRQKLIRWRENIRAWFRSGHQQ